MTDAVILQHAKDTAAAMTALETGSPQAIADCQRRQREAQKVAQRIVDSSSGPTAVTSGHTPAGSAEWAEREATFTEGE